jgi:Mycothiol maleylpyruvate isomerase N-terminal domain
VAALDEAYRGVTRLLGGLGEDDFLLPARCLGWTVTDCLYHLLGDARRALIALATPAGRDPGTDFVSYWRRWRPGGDDALVRARAVRLAAAAVTAVGGPGMLAEAWGETASAAVRLARLAPYPVVSTQGHALAVDDFAATLATEATVHHLDMIGEPPAAPGPAVDCLSLVRRTLDGLLGEPVRAGWDDIQYALKGTGRCPLSEEDRALLGAQAERFPLLG